jgi:hypothetical protein
VNGDAAYTALRVNPILIKQPMLIIDLDHDRSIQPAVRCLLAAHLTVCGVTAALADRTVSTAAFRLPEDASHPVTPAGLDVVTPIF